MPKFSTYFRLDKTQAELDFVDIDTDIDTPLYVDPYAIEIRNDELSENLKYHIVTLFEDVLLSLRNGDTSRAQLLTENLHEPEETFLGVSSHQPQGRGLAREQADTLLHALTNSKAYQTGLLRDIAEAGLFVRNINRDKISDLTTNIIRGPLIEYTQHQCELHEVSISKAIATAPCWNPDDRRWDGGLHDLPVISGKPVILIPKIIVRRTLSGWPRVLSPSYAQFYTSRAHSRWLGPSSSIEELNSCRTQEGSEKTTSVLKRQHR